MTRRTRRRIALAFLGLAALAAGIPLYARYIEPAWLRLDARDVWLEKANPSAPIVVLHLSDFHASRYVSYSHIARAVAMGLRQKPDLICLTGDYIVRLIAERDRYKAILSQLSAAAPTFACLGNHDGGRWAESYGGNARLTDIIGLLKESGITCLVNESATVTVRGQPIRIVGLGDLWAEMTRPADCLAARNKGDGMPVIVLSHNPDSKTMLSGYEWDVMLCGHSHGGQLSLPFLGTPFAPLGDKQYAEGLHRWDGRWIYVTRGVGNLHGVRFNCRPQVSVIRLHGSSARERKG